MRLVVSIAVIGLLVYLGAALFIYVGQRSMLFMQDKTDASPALAGVPHASVQRLRTGDGTEITSWFVQGTGPALAIYFHGNGGSLAFRGPRIEELEALGLSVLAIDYRGYGASAGNPSEAGLAEDADAAYAAALERGFTPEKIILYGESLGSGVAVALAARHPVAGLTLDAPYSSVADVAADRYWMFPVRWLLRDQFRSDRLIGGIQAPILMLHGDHDGVIPIRYGCRLLSFAGPHASFETVSGAGHTVLQEPSAREAVKAWLAAIAGSQ